MLKQWKISREGCDCGKGRIKIFKDWKDKEDILVNMYFNENMSTKQIGDLFGVSKNTISRSLNRMGYELRHVGHDRSNAKYKVDVDYFKKINTEEKAYILGFVLADGHVSKQNSLMITLHEQDKDILIKINGAMKSNYPIKKIKDKYVALFINSKDLCEDLKKIGIVHNKSNFLEMEKIVHWVPSDLMKHFIRGMFDGDGSIRIYKYPYFKKHSYHFGFTGLYPVVTYFYSFFNMHTKLTRETDKVFTCTSKSIGDIFLFKKRLYDEATIYMDRKYNTFNKAEKLYIKEHLN